MKRSRIDDGQFVARVGPGGGAPSAGVPQSGNHSGGGGGLVHGAAGGGSVTNRILTTQHNSAPSIQYLNTGGTIKSSVHPDASASGTGSAPTVQYTTYYPYNPTIPAKTVHSSTATGVSSAGSGVGGGGAQMQILTTVGGGNNPVRGAGISTKHIQSTNANHSQQQQQQQQPSINSSIGGSAFGQEKMQRLKVEDALSYLDQVKYKFGNQPQVYNDFLDIMKEFKSQSIDTPGVIQRVSNLFKGHPELIVGFNTFLPPGYKIEVQANDQGVAFQVSVSVPSPSGSNSIQIPTSPHKNTIPIVHTISQTSVNNPLVVSASGGNTLQSNIGNLSTSGSHSMNVPVQQQQQQQSLPLQTTHDGVGGPQNHSQQQQQQQQQPPIAISVRDRQLPATGTTATGMHAANVVAAASGVGGISVNMVNTSSVPRAMDGTVMHLHGSASTTPAPTNVAAAAAGTNNDIVNSQGHALHHISQAHQTILQAEQTGGNAGQPVEFNHAISYVNKIKNRFTQQPEKYKRFLEILHAYQKEQKNLREGIGPSTKTLSEAEVYSQVAKLFDQQDDLLREFGQFLPDASNHTTAYYYKVPCTANTAMLQEHGKKTVGGSAATTATLHPHQLQQQQQQQTSAAAKSAYLTSLPMTSGGSSGPSTVSIALDNDCGTADAQQMLPDKGYGHPTSGGVIGVLGCGNLAMRGLDKDRSHSAGSGSSPATNNHNVSGKYHPGHINTIVQQHHAGDKRSSQSAYGNAAGNSLNASGSSRGGGDGHPPSKRQKPVCRDITLADASKYGSLSDYAFFDKVRKALRNPDVYENFLRCLTLFNQEIISKSELVGLISPFLSRFPELHRWFQDFLGSAASAGSGGPAGTNVESVPLPAAVQRNDHRQAGVGGGAGGEHNNSQDIDLSTCKRLGASYCALPRNQESRKCTGRTALCREVLNDQWASFPTWAEDSTFVTSRKTHYEEIIYRCEDERFELDVVLETNSATIRVLEGVQKRMSRMPPDELSRFRLDDCLGGNSTTIHQRALRRIYGDKAADVIQGLKKNPMVAVPVALKRLKTKEEEWREAQKGFNKQWREQNEKYYLKSLDHQGINFKQNDIKALRSKSLFNEIEALYDERHEQNDDMTPSSGPHMVLSYKDKSILEDASNLLIHHVKRQTSIQKQEKTKIKYILRQFLPDMFFSPRQQLSDDERDDDADGSPEIGCKFRRDDPKGQTSNAYASAENSSLPSDDHNGIGNNRSPSAVFETAGASTTAGLGTSAANSRFNAQVKAEPTVVDADNSFSDTKMDFTIDGGTTGRANPHSNADQSGAAVQPKEEVLVDNHVTTGSKAEEAYTLFFGSSNWYLFLRLHWILCDRLYNVYEQAQILLGEELVHRNNRRESTATALRLKPKADIKIEEYYPTFVDMLKNVLDGNMETNSYEDSLREMFGIHAYMAFTLDRVVTNAVRQLQHAVTERGAIECVELFQAQQKKNGAGGLCKTAPLRASTELTYQRRAEAILQDENCFKVYIFNNNCRVTLELLDTETDDTEKTVNNTQKWSTYVDHLKCPISGEALPSSSAYAGENSSRGNRSANVEIKSEVSDADTNRFFLNRRPLFLNRNIRRFKVRHSRQTANAASPEIAIVGRPSSVNSSKSQSCAAADATSRKLPSAANFDTSDTEDDVHKLAKSSTIGVGGPSPPHSARIPERLGAVAGPRENYTIDDSAEMRLNMTSYRMVFVMNKDVVFYKHNSIMKSRKAHPSVTRAMAAKFYKYVDNWCKDHVNEADFQQCYDWFMGRDKDAKVNTTTQIQHTDTNRTPYRAYNKYKCK